MSAAKIAIIDYQMGNLRSVQKALEHVGYSATVTNQSADVDRADKIILPGVGAFEDAMRELRATGLVDSILASIDAGKPFLGICLGLQMLFDLSLEGGQFEGLKLLPGRVERFDLPNEYKVPHMGWNRIRIHQPDCPLLKGISEEAYVYFVHSYHVVPQQSEVIWTTADYGGEFCASVWRDNLFATQFHPEKSQRDGLQLLRNFAEL